MFLMLWRMASDFVHLQVKTKTRFGRHYFHALLEQEGELEMRKQTRRADDDAIRNSIFAFYFLLRSWIRFMCWR